MFVSISVHGSHFSAYESWTPCIPIPLSIAHYTLMWASGLMIIHWDFCVSRSWSRCELWELSSCLTSVSFAFSPSLFSLLSLFTRLSSLCHLSLIFLPHFFCLAFWHFCLCFRFWSRPLFWHNCFCFHAFLYFMLPSHSHYLPASPLVNVSLP